MGTVIIVLAVLSLIARPAVGQTRAADVIVIGAGVAGIKAAADLAKQNRSVIVLEARSRAFGRIDSQKPAGWPITIELGAQWFHGGTRSNPVLQYAQSLRTPRLTITPTGSGGDATTFDSTRAPGTDKTISNALDSTWTDLFDEFESVLKEDYQESAEDTDSLEQKVALFIADKGLTGINKRGFLSQIESNYVQEYAASPKDLSLAYFDADKDMHGQDSITANYSSVFGSMVTGLGPAVRLGVVVTSVTNTAAGVQVAALNSRTKLREVFTAKLVLCTLPLGVLKANYAKLFPEGAAAVDALAVSRKRAIATLGMGLLNKVVLQFPAGTPFWRAAVGNDQWIANLPSEGAAVQWNEFFQLQKATRQNILVAFQAGDSAYAAEKLSDNETITSVMTTLRAMFARVPDPVRYVITRWAQDPYALGSYSYHKVGAAEFARRDLCAPSGRLFFAGEACDVDYPSTVQGAWLSGQKAAADIARSLAVGSG